MVRGAGFEQLVKPTSISKRVLSFMISESRPLSLRDIYEALDEKSSRVEDCLKRLWKKEVVLRTKEPVFKFQRVHRGRAGLLGNTRAINYFIVNDGDVGSNFVKYHNRKKDGRSKGIKSKSRRVLEFLRQNKDKAFYSVDIVKSLGVNRCDVMANMRRYEKKGLIFIRGYQTHDHRSPFEKGYILTWVDEEKPREQALKEAFEFVF